MQMLFSRALALSALVAACAPALAAAQTPAPTGAAVAAPSEPTPGGVGPGGRPVLTTTPCSHQQLEAPAATPPANVPFVWMLDLCFDKQGNSPTIETET